jgi:peptide-methionine (R)-S-oxide reductase
MGAKPSWSLPPVTRQAMSVDGELLRKHEVAPWAEPTGSGERVEELRAMEAKRFPVTRTDEEWRRLLTPEQYQVMRRHGTEAPGSCALNYEKRGGTFVCAGCGQPLFVSKTKFESGTGWPSFNDPVAGAVETSTDRSHGMVRTEAHCSRCGSHLGHVFEDGPPPTHLRYCMNGVAMNFQPEAT